MRSNNVALSSGPFRQAFVLIPQAHVPEVLKKHRYSLGSTEQLDREETTVTFFIESKFQVFEEFGLSKVVPTQELLVVKDEDFSVSSHTSAEFQAVQVTLSADCIQIMVSEPLADPKNKRNTSEFELALNSDSEGEQAHVNTVRRGSRMRRRRRFFDDASGEDDES